MDHLDGTSQWRVRMAGAQDMRGGENMEQAAGLGWAWAWAGLRWASLGGAGRCGAVRGGAGLGGAVRRRVTVICDTRCHVAPCQATPCPCHVVLRHVTL